MVPMTTVAACVITLLISFVLPIVVLIGFAVKNKKQGIVSAWLLGPVRLKQHPLQIRFFGIG